MGDSLTIRHRLPRLWERVVAGEVHHWKARQIAALTADLSVATVGEVDEQTSRWVGQLPWASFLKTLDATILEVDEQAYRQREKLAAAKREVRATQSEEGLRTLIARGEAGDVALMLALYQRVAECLAEDGDEDPLPVRMSKAIGIIAQPARLTDLLARHADDPDPHQEPWEQVAAHHADETDPWADDLPPAGWETARHGNFYQPPFDEDEWWDQPRSDQPTATDAEEWDWPVDPPISERTWPGTSAAATGRDTRTPVIRSSPATLSTRRPGLMIRLRMITRWIGDHSDEDDDADSAVAELDTVTRPRRAPAPTNVLRSAHRRCFVSSRVSLSLRRCRCDPAAVADRVPATRLATPDPGPARRLRTDGGDARPPERPDPARQPRRGPHRRRPDPARTAAPLPGPARREDQGLPVIDPAETASADSYEIPLRLRRAMAIRHPRSVFPHSPTTSRMDLDHTPAYQQNGPPGQTGMHSLGPLARGEHRPKTVGQWRSKQPEPGTYLWRDPEGWIAITTNQGTLVLGHTDWAHQLWNSAP